MFGLWSERDLVDVALETPAHRHVGVHFRLARAVWVRA